MKKINTYWKIRALLDIYTKGSIDFPEYQREPNVWNLQKKQRLIDSILRGFDIAPIYVFRKEDNTYDCIDGRQRINAILSYLGKNKADTETNGFSLKIVNEIFEDANLFTEVNDREFTSLLERDKQKILDYQINVIVISEVENEEELNLLFLRLQLGSILNAGEKLHAMTGDMRDFIFKDIGSHDFFVGINIPYRRYARQQVAAQITLNYFSKKETGEYHRSRYLDLQEFFKQRNRFSDKDKKLTDEIKEYLDKICLHFKDKLHLIGNRAIAVSLFLFTSDLIGQDRENEMDHFKEFLVEFIKTLKWQIPEGVHMDPAYYYLLDFQTYVTQAAGEKYAIQNRYNFLDEGFNYYKQNHAITGDDDYYKNTGKKADSERERIQL